MTTLGWVTSMVDFAFGINLVFGLIEEVGYMARVSYVFDHTMNRLGLQGKSIMPMLVNFGCTIGGAVGTRVIDSYSQRILTIALAWAVPCGVIFAVVPTLATAFFGGVGGFLVMVLIFIIAVTFNVPCLMALNAPLHETHSVKWTLRIALYYVYVAIALVLSALTYHISSLFF